MGEDFGVMMKEAWEFDYRWHDANDPQRKHTYPQGMISDLRCVRFVMRGDDKRDYPLTGVKVLRPTDQEAQAYAVVRQLVQVSPILHQPASGSGATTAVQAEAVTDTGPHPFKEVCKELGCKPTTLRDYCRKLRINFDAITAADLAQIKDHREKRKQRPHLKQWHAPRHGTSPKRRGNKGD